MLFPAQCKDVQARCSPASFVDLPLGLAKTTQQAVERSSSSG